LEDALVRFDDRKRRLRNLERAMVLGNGYHGKVKIIFKTGTGELKRVYATVRQVNCDSVALQSGATMPTRSIVAVEFF
jgi:hypothetical protein